MCYQPQYFKNMLFYNILFNANIRQNIIKKWEMAEPVALIQK